LGVDSGNDNLSGSLTEQPLCQPPEDKPRPSDSGLSKSEPGAAGLRRIGLTNVAFLYKPAPGARLL
jgi:hypothetical protein